MLVYFSIVLTFSPGADISVNVIIVFTGSFLSALAWVSVASACMSMSTQWNLRHFGTNINSGHLSFIKRLSLFRGIIHYNYIIEFEYTTAVHTKQNCILQNVRHTT